MEVIPFSILEKAKENYSTKLYYQERKTKNHYNRYM